MLRTLCVILTTCFVLCSVRPAAAEFTLNDSAGDHLDVLLDGKIVARYMYAHDTSSAERHDITYKPYLHVFDSSGSAPITKGPGGQFTHHRGIFIGWMKIGFNGKSYDRWHMKGGDIVHQKFLVEKAGKDSAEFTSLTSWMDEAHQPILEEERSFVVRPAPSPARLIIDVTSKLTAPRGDITLDGDPEHAGIQFRPANEVKADETTYVFPRENADAKKDRDYPWLGESFTLAGRRHSVVQINHSENPRDTRFSAYRDYGRFGAFPVAKIPSGQSLTLRYRYIIADGDMPPAAFIQQVADQFNGVTTPTPVPPITVKAADKPAPAKPKAPAKK